MTDAVQEIEQGLARVASGFEAAFAACRDEPSLRAAAARLIGPNGELTGLLKRMPSVPVEHRKPLGQRANELKRAVQAAFEARLGQIARAAREADLRGPAIDPSLPGRTIGRGALHPITRTMFDLIDALESLGFELVDAPEIELVDFNFTRLGFPPDHPATDMQDSFFVKSSTPAARFEERLLLRTHTSNAQVHVMTTRKDYPIRAMHAGAVYRRDDDATHSPQFHQIEGFWIDRGITMAHLRGVLSTFVRRLFGNDVPVRFRPSYFPFVEPGGELDVGCTLCRRWPSGPLDARRAGASDCRVCKGSGWLEVLGCGMIHPVVFELCGHDPSQVTGFAFGMGIDRLAMLRHNVSNIGDLFDNDIRFLSQL